MGSRAESPARQWVETEYCLDNASGLLLVSSIAPGAYAVYGYGANLQFHGRAVPDRITFYEAGAEALDAQLSIADAEFPDPGLMQPTQQMISNGPAIQLGALERFAFSVSSPLAAGSVMPVIVQAEIGVEGNVSNRKCSSPRTRPCHGPRSMP